MAIGVCSIHVLYEGTKRWVERENEDIENAVGEFIVAEGTYDMRADALKDVRAHFIETRIRQVLAARFPVNFAECRFRAGICEYVVQSWEPWGHEVPRDIAKIVDGPGSLRGKVGILIGDVREPSGNPCGFFLVIALVVVVANLRFASP